MKEYRMKFTKEFVKKNYIYKLFIFTKIWRGL